jgi:hypothetical protein
VRDEARRRIGIAVDRGTSATEDARLLEADRLAVVAEEGLVVEVDAHDDGDVGVDDVDRIEPPAEAHLEDEPVDLGVRKSPARERAELEVRERRVATRRFHALEAADELVVAASDAIDAHALVVAREVGDVYRPDAVAGLDEDALEVGAGRTLAVRSADGDARRPTATAPSVTFAPATSRTRSSPIAIADGCCAEM